MNTAEKYLGSYRLNDYAKATHSFVWSDFCDWYIELIKIKINDDPKHAVRILDKALDYYDDILKILHPVIPYVTEELWHIVKEGREDKSISLELIKKADNNKIDTLSESKFELVKEIVTAIRNLKTQNNIAPSVKSDVYILTDAQDDPLFAEFNNYIRKLCNLENLTIVERIDPGKKFASSVIHKYEINLSIGEHINIEQQTENIRKEIEKLNTYLSSLDKKLSNENFLNKASADIINKEREKQSEAKEKLAKLQKLI